MRALNQMQTHKRCETSSTDYKQSKECKVVARQTKRKKRNESTKTSGRCRSTMGKEKKMRKN